MPLTQEEQSELEQIQARKKELSAGKITGAESFLRGGGQGLTFGFADEAEAAARSLPELFSGGFDDVSEEYGKQIGPIRERYERAAEANPVASGAGNIAGALVPGLGQAALLGRAAKGAGALAKGAKFLGSTVKGVGLTGAAEGALAGYGTSEEGAENVMPGAVVGLGMGLGAASVGKWLAKPAKEVGEEIKFGALSSAPDKDDLAKSAIKYADDSFGAPAPRKDAEQINSSWKLLTGEDAPPMALDANKERGKLWSDVTKSTTRAGALERKPIESAYRGIEGVAEEIEKTSGRITAEDSGHQIKKILSDSFDSKMEPIETGYQELEGVFDGIPVSKPAIKGMLTRIQREVSTDVSGKPQQMLENIRSKLEHVNDVASLRDFRTNLRKAYKWGDLTDNEKTVLRGVYDNITKVRNNSISREAAALKGTEFEQFLTPAHLKKLLQLDVEYGKTLNDFTSLVGIDTKRGMSPKAAFRDYLRETPLESYFKDLYDKGDIAKIKSLQKSNPGLFDVLRKRALSESIESATSARTGRATAEGVIAKAAGKRPELAELTLGELTPKVRASQDVLSSMPPNFNPSDTATKAYQYNPLLNPTKLFEETSRQAQYEAKRRLLRGQGGTATGLLAGNIPSPKEFIAKITRIPGGNRFAEALSNSLQRGESSYAATFFLLGQSEPEFRKIMDEQGNSN